MGKAKLNKPLPTRILQMHFVHPWKFNMDHFKRDEPYQKCKGCPHLKKHQMGNSWYKCHKFGPTGSKATDWRVNWPACGIYRDLITENRNIISKGK